MALVRTGWCPECNGWMRLLHLSGLGIMPPHRWECDCGWRGWSNDIRWRPPESGAASKAGGAGPILRQQPGSARKKQRTIA